MSQKSTQARIDISGEEYLYISPEGFERISGLLDVNDSGKNVNWTTDYTVELPIRVRRCGPGSETPETIMECFIRAVQNHGKEIALQVKRMGKVLSWTYEDYYNECCQFGKALLSLGITRYKSVNIIGFNSPEWFISFFGSIFSNNLPVGVYSTNGPDACHYVAEHSEAEVIVVENKEHLNKYLDIWNKLPNLKYIVVYNDTLAEDIPDTRRSNIFLYKEFIDIGKAYQHTNSENSLEFRMKSQKPGNCCTMVYTSGTTGQPKAVILSHDNYVWTASGSKDYFKYAPENNLLVSYLPLSHVAGQLLDMMITLLKGITVYFAEPTALQGTLVNTLQEVRPTIFFGVPRIYEKIEEKMKAQVEESIEKARQIGIEGTKAELLGQPTPFGFGFFKTLVYNSIKKKMGLDRAGVLAFGAAPLSLYTQEFFLSLNMFLGNSYGMSECSGPLTGYNHNKPPPVIDLKSAGIALQGAEIHIENPDEQGIGEICIRGRSRFMGYFKNENETKKTIDSKGYLHSGDIGRLNENGYLYITGRIKELIITAGGENIAPILIENKVKDVLPVISNIMLIGEQKKFVSALITFKTVLNQQMLPTDQLTPEVIKIFQNAGSSATTVNQAKNCDNVKAYIQNGINTANNCAISKAHHIRKWTILDQDFTINQGDLTPTLKLKRDFVAKKYNHLIELMYQEPKL